MTLSLRPFLVAVAVLTMLHTPPAAQEKTPLTKDQIERFIASYDAMLTMVSKYWGDRRFTPHGVIMPHRGTIERAMGEMKAEGTLQDFDRLFKSQGFDGYEAWRVVGNRVTDAQFQIRATENGKPVQQFTPEGLEDIARKRDALLTPNPQLPDSVRLEKLETYNRMLAQHERWQTGLRDMEAVKPYVPRIMELWRRREVAMHAAKKQR